MKASVVSYLACLQCHADFELTDVSVTDDLATHKEILEGTLTCLGCGSTVPIFRGIPRFVDGTMSLQEDINTGARFTESWSKFSRMDEKYFKQMFDWLSPVSPEHVRGKVILEGGCGKGRHSAIMSSVGAKDVISVDIGNSVDVAYTNVGHLPNVHIIQADIMRLPLKQKIDFAFSIGVIHHMSKPKDGFKSLVGKVRPGGSIAVWVYGRENNWWVLWFVNPIRFVTSRLPERVTACLSYLLSVVVFVMSRFASFWTGLCQKNPRLPKFFYQDYLSYIGQFDFTEVYNIVFDHLIAPVAHYVSRDEFFDWFKSAGLPNPTLRWHNRNSWTGLSFKGNTAEQQGTKEIDATVTCSPA